MKLLFDKRTSVCMYSVCMCVLACGFHACVDVCVVLIILESGLFARSLFVSRFLICGMRMRLVKFGIIKNLGEDGVTDVASSLAFVHSVLLTPKNVTRAYQCLSDTRTSFLL